MVLLVEGRVVVVEGRSVVDAGRCEVAIGRLAMVGRLAVVGLVLLVVGREDVELLGRTLFVAVRPEEALALLGLLLGFGVRELIEPAVLLRRTLAT